MHGQSEAFLGQEGLSSEFKIITKAPSCLSPGGSTKEGVVEQWTESQAALKTGHVTLQSRIFNSLISDKTRSQSTSCMSPMTTLPSLRPWMEFKNFTSLENSTNSGSPTFQPSRWRNATTTLNQILMYFPQFTKVSTVSFLAPMKALSSQLFAV